MKLLAFLLFFIVLTLASTTAEADDSCEWEMMQHSIDRCRSFLQHGPQRSVLRTGRTITGEEEVGVGAPEECCVQLKEVREDCRCGSILDMVEEVKWEEGFRGGQDQCRGRCVEMTMRGRLLPAMCNTKPHTCSMTDGGREY